MEKQLTEEMILKAIDSVRMDEISFFEGFRQLEDKLKQLQQLIPVQRVSSLRGESGIKCFVKRMLRKLLRWYIDPIIAQQDHINEQLVTILQLLAYCIRNVEHIPSNPIDCSVTENGKEKTKEI